MVTGESWLHIETRSLSQHLQYDSMTVSAVTGTINFLSEPPTLTDIRNNSGKQSNIMTILQKYLKYPDYNNKTRKV